MSVLSRLLARGGVAFVLSSSLLAAPGDLDATFGGDGWVSTGFQSSPANDRASTLARQQDGKLLVAGSSDGYITVLRYNEDGSQDASFNANASSVTVRGDGNAVIQQADGKVVVGGTKDDTAMGNGYRVVLLRYNSDGTPDTTLDADGVIVTAIGAAYDFANALIQQTDGKLVLAGTSWNGTDRDIAVVRYNSNGVLDSTFGGDGIVTTAVGASDDAGLALIQQADGKLVVAGSVQMGSYTDYAMVRYNSDGVLDTAFSDDGKLVVSIDNFYDEAYSITQQQDGKLVVAGTSYDGSNYNFAVMRCNDDGVLDTTFDGDGKTVTSVDSGYDFARSVIQQADGKLVVAGNSNSGDKYDLALVRYNSNGSLDAGFDGDGKLKTSVTALSNYGYSVIQQPDGNLVVAGYSSHWGNDEDIVLVRYSSSGSLDTAFDSDGKVVTGLFRSNDYGLAVVQQSDGKLVTAGYSWISNEAVLAVTRHNNDGSLDNGFDGDGRLSMDVGAGGDYGYSVIQQTDGKLVVAVDSNAKFSLVRFNSDGSLDATFGVGGKVITSYDPDGYGDGYWVESYPWSLIQQADGKLVVVGHAYYVTREVMVARYNSDGTLDTSFDGDGVLMTDMGFGADAGNDVIQQLDGKLVVAGSAENAEGGYDIAMVRYNPNGSLDTGFGVGGKVITMVGDADDAAMSLIQQPDGKLVVAGYGSETGVYQTGFVLVCYNTDGALDTTFDSDGIVLTAVGSDADFGSALVLQPDGKLAVAGASYNGSGYDFALVRYNSDGSLDNSFDGDGKRTIAAAQASSDPGPSLIRQADGKLVMASSAVALPAGREFVVIRFEGEPLDTDNDGTPDDTDAFPLDPTEWLDTDNDGTGNNADWDDDNDGVPDAIDADSLDAGNTGEVILPLNGGYRGTRLGEGVESR